MQELLEFGQIAGLILALVPIVMGCTLFVLIVRMIIRNQQNETNKRTEVALAAIEKNPDIDVEELLKKMAPKQKSLKEKQVNKLQWGTITSLIGLVFVGLGTYIGYVGGYDADDPVVASVFGFIFLALRTLPPKERSSITLFYLNGYSVKEIAQITETSEDAVKKQLSRGRDKLKERLKL